jgi:predicted nucleotide-binding protein
MSKPRLFMGSANTKESLRICEDLQGLLEKDILAEVWNQGAFGLNLPNLENLKRQADACDLALFLFLADKPVPKGAHNKPGSGLPRLNVIFEFGFFMHALGLERCICMQPSDFYVDPVSDTDGYVRANFSLADWRINGRPVLGPVRLEIIRLCERLDLL